MVLVIRLIPVQIMNYHLTSRFDLRADVQRQDGVSTLRLTNSQIGGTAGAFSFIQLDQTDAMPLAIRYDVSSGFCSQNEIVAGLEHEALREQIMQILAFTLMRCCRMALGSMATISLLTLVHTTFSKSPAP